MTPVLAPLLAILLALPSIAMGDSEELSLEEELSFIQEEFTVSSASRYKQSVNEAPAAVTVIGEEEIRRYGFLNIDDALRTVIGLYLTNDRSYSYLGVRGFGLPSDYNSRILFLLDGHRLNEPIYGSALLGWESGIDLGSISRIEVVRGPASALYGTSALFGVVSLFSKGFDADSGEEVHAALGEPGLARLAVRSRRALGTAGDGYSVALHALDRAGNGELYYGEYDGMDYNEDGSSDYDGTANDWDGERAAGFSGRFRRGAFTLSAFSSDREKDVPTAAYETIFDSGEDQTRDRRSFAAAAWSDEGGDLVQTVRATLDSYAYDGWYAYAYDYDYTVPDFHLPPFTVMRDRHEAVWAGAEYQGSWSGLKGHRLVFGGQYSWTKASMETFDIDPSASYQDEEHSFNTLTGYLQDEIALSGKVNLVLGLNHNRYDPDTFKAGEIDRTNPRAALVWSAGKDLSVKALYGEAFRAPNLFEMYYNDGGTTQITNPALEPEVMRTAELVAEMGLPLSLRARASVYSNRIESLIFQGETDAGAGTVIQFQNASEDVVSEGLEVEVRRAMGEGWSGYVSFALQNTELEEAGDALPNSPGTLANAGISFPVAGRNSFLSIDAHYLGERDTADLSDKVDPYTLVNLTFLSRGLVKGLEASLTVHNVTDAQFADPGAGGIHLQTEIPQDGRNLTAQLRYRF